MASDAQPSCAIAATTSLESSSIKATLRQHERERLYVHPQQWDHRHLTLLGCRFHKSKVLKAGSEQHKQHQAEVLEHEVRSAATALLRRCTAESKCSTIETLFKHHGICPVSSELHFHFGQQPVTTLPVDRVFSTSSSGLVPPTFAYLDLKALESRWNMSQRKKKKPTNVVEHPYIAAVLIAMAQARRLRTTLAGDIEHATAVKAGSSGQEDIKKPCEVSRSQLGTKVHLLALHSARNLSLYLYTADVSDALLDRLDHPSRSLSGAPVRICYQRIPFTEASCVATMSNVITVARGNTTAEDATHPTSMHAEI